MKAGDYRPESFDGVAGQPTDEIEALIDGARTPNFLFYGPPGTGKTTVAHLIAKEIQGSKSELMEFNASDDRGIDAVRDEIIPASGQTTLTGSPRVIFLDEMDSMTTDAQQALRQPMEQSDGIFILACNDVGAVHDAIRSRCHEYEFGELSNRAIRSRLDQLARQDGVTLSPNDYETIIGFANGDMRRAIQRYAQVVRGITSDEDTERIEAAASNLMD